MSAGGYGRHRILDITADSQTLHCAKMQPVDTRIVNLNVLGFSKEKRLGWLSACNRTTVLERHLAWCLQEIHVDTEDGAEELRALWQKLWGLRLQDRQSLLSFWSTGSSNSAGVTILLTPSAAQTTVWNKNQWNTRQLGVTINGTHVLSVDAINQRGN